MRLRFLYMMSGPQLASIRDTSRAPLPVQLLGREGGKLSTIRARAALSVVHTGM